MRPRPQCDTVKWQESVAGEPLVQGIYHLKPSDPLCLWEGGREGARGRQRGGGRQRLRRKEKVTKKLDGEQVKRNGGEKKDKKWSKWIGGKKTKYMDIAYFT